MSTETDSQWMIVEEQYRKLYGLSGGFTLKESRGSEELLRHVQKQVYPTLSGEGVTSGMFSGASQAALARRAEGRKDFWLTVDTEVIVYGAPEPDASVTVGDAPVTLYPDGTFSLRFALPEGEHSFRIRAVNGDGDMEKEATPVVTRKTK